ncbi:MAG: hypothetical protein OXO52_14755 [Rhodospirillales bacterium]|nr:hypothetical protein [Rhodospirillales bacterium]MDE0381716.1 hypothetical protein [Rhodospirillales bacterium]
MYEELLSQASYLRIVESLVVLPDIAQDAGAARHLERQTHAPVDANCPCILARPDFLESPSLRKWIACLDLTKCSVYRCLVLLVELLVRLLESSQLPECGNA